MEFKEPTVATEVAFLGINLCVLLALALGIYVSRRATDDSQVRKTAIVMGFVIAWLSFVCLLASSGVVARYPMPLLPIFLILVIGLSVGFALSPFGRLLAFGIPVSYLVLFQAFRLPLELILHQWALQGSIPTSMTWSGQNLDVVSGAVALFAFPFANRHRSVAWVANIIGMGLLLNVLRVAILSSPLPFGWDVKPPLQLVFHFPYVLIVPVCIGGAWIGHVVLTRSLLSATGGSEQGF